MTAFADPPKKATARNGHECVDEDADGYCVAPDDDKKIEGWDCDDKNPSRHPGAKEVWDNGEDENCDGEDSVTPALALLRAFGVSSGNKTAVIKLIKEIAACEAIDECHVDKTAGKFRTDDGHYFIDIDCNGVREVVNQDAKDAEDQQIKRGAGCKKAPAPRKKAKAVSLPDAVTPTGSEPAKQPASRKVSQVPAVDPALVTKAQATADRAEGKADKAQTTADAAQKAVDAQAEAITKAGEGLASLDEGLKTEGKERKAADKKLKAEIGEVRDSDREHGKQIAKMQESGFFLQGSLGAGSLIQQPAGSTDSGITSRGRFAPNLRVGANFGQQSPSGTKGLFIVVAPTLDSGTDGWEASSVMQGGLEAMKRVSSSLLVGGHLMVQQHAAGGSIMNPNAVSRGAGLGLSVAAIGSGESKIGAQLRLTAGYETFGMQGDLESNVHKGGLFAGISLDLLYGSSPGKVKQNVAPAVAPPSEASDTDDEEEEADAEDKADEE